MLEDGIVSDKFEDLEKLNAQIDVWIDEEKYGEVEGHLVVSEEADNYLGECFGDPHCTTRRDEDWSKALDYGLGKNHNPDAIWREGCPLAQCDVRWSRLFWAKLLRARIQKKGTDCYFRRLDNVVGYLENNLPQPGRSKDETKLAVMYLLELSAASIGYEMLGFAQRSHRIMKDHLEDDKEFCDFYNLWASYNIGVAYFHERHYRKAVLEFNEIIRQVRQLGGNNGNNSVDERDSISFFADRFGDLLLFLPSVLFRADIQLKLQLAYHSLDTLQRFFWPEKDLIPRGVPTDHKLVRARLIEAEAHQQMGRLHDSESWKYLTNVYGSLSDGGELGQRIECRMLQPGADLQNLRKRFVDVLIKDHVDWLGLEGVEKDESYLGKLMNAFSSPYFTMVAHNAYNREGYYQQLAKYLKILVGSEQGGMNVAKKLYGAAKRDGLLELEKEGWVEKERRVEGKRKRGQGNRLCLYCSPKGIDLRRLPTEHYDWFTNDMLHFFKKASRSKKLDNDKDAFIRRLIELERNSGEDVRIRDLTLRYKSRDVLKQLPPRWYCSGKNLCWNGSTDTSGFAGLLQCAQGRDDGKQGDHLPAKHYERIMDKWDRSFRHQLEVQSSHESQGDGLYFLGLQRWNSSSPAQGRSVGGGYLLYHTNRNGCVDMGIAIDPGFDFVRNLFHMGFSLSDIDIVLISHAHIDHIRDFESMIILLKELQNRGRQGKRIHVILTLGTYRRLEHIIEDPILRYFIEPYIIDINKEISRDYFEKLAEPKGVEFRFERSSGGDKSIERFRAVLPGSQERPPNKEMSPSINIRPTRAYHDDFTGRSDSFGFLIELDFTECKDQKVTFGYTGDTKWVYPEVIDPLAKSRRGPKGARMIKDITKQYRNCDVLLVHLGSLIDTMDTNEDRHLFASYNQCVKHANGEKRCEKLVLEKKHPYLVGMLRLLSNLCRYLKDNESKGMPLVLISEFGEELRGGIRRDLVLRLRQTYERRLAFLPVDVGTNVQVWRQSDKNSKGNEAKQDKRAYKVWCVQCDEFVPVDEADFESYGEDEALFCVCTTCRSATPHNVLQDRLRHLYDVGRELRAGEIIT